MAKLSVAKGATSILCRIFIQDSSSTVGAGLTGLVYNSSGLVCYRMRDDDGNAGGTAISLVTATKGTWTSGGFVEKDATNCPGWYEFGIPNAALASGSRSVGIHFKGATNMAPLALEIELTGVDNQDGVRFGQTALPNVAAAASGGLATCDANNSIKTQGNVKKNTAFAKFPFLMTDNTNHAPATGKTVTVTRMIDGGTFGAGGLSAVTEISDGMYTVDFAASDLNGNVIVLKATASACDVTLDRVFTFV